MVLVLRASSGSDAKCGYIVVVVDSNNLPGTAPTPLPYSRRTTTYLKLQYYKKVVGPLLTFILPLSSSEVYWKGSVKIKCPL